MIVWLASYPRSGNSLARLLLQTCFQARSGSLYPNGETSETGSVVDLAEARSHPEPFFVETHEIPADDLPAIYIVRDGRDALVSYALSQLTHERSENFPGIRKAFLDILEQLIATGDYAEGWSAHVRAWTQRSAATAVVHYEELIRDGAVPLERSLRSLGIDIPYQPREEVPVRLLHARFSWFFRTATSASWHGEMKPRFEHAFWERHGEVMREFGYSREDFALAGSNQESSAWLRRFEVSDAARAGLAEQVHRVEAEIADLRFAAKQRLELLVTSDSERRHLQEIAEERLRRLNASTAECQSLRETAEERLRLIQTLIGEIESLRKGLGPPDSQPLPPTLARTATTAR